MKGASLRALFAGHSLAGICLGALLYLVCLSGTIALFVDELTPWTQPAVRATAAAPAASLDALVAAVHPRLAGGRAPLVILEPGVAGDRVARVKWRRPDDSHNRIVDLSARTAQPLDVPYLGVPAFLADLHTDLLLPKPWGRYLVGLAGLVMLLSAATGILVHRKPLRQAFTLRTRRSRLLAYTDWHKIMGLWGLPFHLVIAYTGALLGLAGVLVAATGASAFGGDRAAAQAAFQGNIPEAAGVAAPTTGLDALVADATARYRGTTPERVIVWHYGDANATVRVDLHDPGTLSSADTLVLYDGATGAFRSALPLDASSGRRVFSAVTPLHYGDYAGLVLKAIYALLGLGASLLCASGTLIWLERRSQRHGARADARHRPRLEAAVAGLFAGLPLVMVLALHAGVWDALPPAADYDPLIAAGAAIWAVAIAAGTLVGRPRGVLRGGLQALAAALGLLPVSNALATGDHLAATAARGDWSVAGVDLVALGLALAVLHAAGRLRGR